MAGGAAERTLGPGYPACGYGLLEAALGRPKATASGPDAYPDLDATAAVRPHSTARNRALIDGSKRLALAALIAFHSRNGRRLTVTSDAASSAQTCPRYLCSRERGMTSPDS